MVRKKAGIYAHIPFCSKRCPYCDFPVVVQKSTLHKDYFKAVIDELEAREELEDYTFDTLYIGGGTPSKFRYLSVLICEFFKKLSFSGNSEITIEFNPEDLTKAKILEVKTFKPRLSLGIQSLNLEVLRFLGRSHSRSEVLAGLRNLARYGFENLNADLIYGVPGIKRDIVEEIKILVEHGIKHFSTYLLTIEPGTHFYSKFTTRINKSVEEEWESVYSTLRNFNFHQYEISNWAIKGFECKHNKKYWSHETVLGLGLGAVSFLQENNTWKRVYNLTSLSGYISSKVKQGFVEMLDLKILEREKQLFQLRTFKPFLAIKPQLETKLKNLAQQNFLIKSKQGYRLSPKGVLSINNLAELLIS